MPTKTLPEQDGNSCAAHCTVIAVADMLDVSYLLTKGYAEEVLWEEIKFRDDGTGNQLLESLVAAENSDPRRMVAEVDLRWNAVKATLKCDETQKVEALKYITDPTHKGGLEAMFNMMKKDGSVATLTIEEGVYYNCSYLMIPGKKAAPVTACGMHNILVTKENSTIYYYNPNETTPKWGRVLTDWKKLDNQNGGRYSYVFTGVVVELKRK